MLPHESRQGWQSISFFDLCSWVCRKMKSIKSDQTPNHLHENERVKPCSCSSMWNKNVLKHVFKSNFSSKIVVFFQIQTMSYKILSCLWVNVIMYHVRVNLRLLKFSNCAYLSWVFWVCNVFWGNNCNILISLYTCWAGSLLLWQRGYRPSAPPLSQHRGCVSPSN